MSGGAPVLLRANGTEEDDPIVLCMEDIKVAADNKLHEVARGRPLARCIRITVNNRPNLQPRLLQLRLNLPSHHQREQLRLQQISAPLARPRRRLEPEHRDDMFGPDSQVPALRLTNRSASNGSSGRRASHVARVRQDGRQHGDLQLVKLPSR